jgi:hypothetical protein
MNKKQKIIRRDVALGFHKRAQIVWNAKRSVA